MVYISFGDLLSGSSKLSGRAAEYPILMRPLYQRILRFSRDVNTGRVEDRDLEVVGGKKFCTCRALRKHYMANYGTDIDRNTMYLALDFLETFGYIKADCRKPHWIWKLVPGKEYVIIEG